MTDKEYSKPSYFTQTPSYSSVTPFRRFNAGTRKAWGASKEEVMELVEKETDPFRQAGMIRGWALTSDDEKAQEATQKLQDFLQAKEREVTPTHLKKFIEQVKILGLSAGVGWLFNNVESLFGEVNNFNEEAIRAANRLNHPLFVYEKKKDPNLFTRNTFKITPREIDSPPLKGHIGYAVGRQKVMNSLFKNPKLRTLLPQSLKALPLVAGGALIASNSPLLEDKAPQIMGASMAPAALLEGVFALTGARGSRSLRPFLPALGALSTGGALTLGAVHKEKQKDERYKKETEGTLSRYLNLMKNEQ